MTSINTYTSRYLKLLGWELHFGDVRLNTSLGCSLNKKNMTKRFLPIILFLTAVFAHAQDFEITGTVLENDTKNPLFGASVVMKDANDQLVSGAVTDDFGYFRLRTNALSGLTLEVSYIGYLKKNINLKEINKDTNLGTIALESSSEQLDEVILSGSLEGKTKALNLQRTADNIKNVVSADLIGRFPDLNVAEALQRVPGVNISRDKGEGSTVNIRGTPLNFTTVQINGEQMPSVQQNGARTESLDLIPADQLAFMEVTKVPTPDMDGDAVGGTINLRTPVATSMDFKMKVESGVGYNDISDGLNGINKIRFDKRFFSTDEVPIGKFGIILSGSTFNSNNSEHSTEASWRGLVDPELGIVPMDQYQYRLTENQRQRLGGVVTLDYKFNRNHQVVFNYMYNQREDNDIRNRLRFDIDSDRGANYITIDSITSARSRRDINLFDERKENHSFNLEGTHKFNNWVLDWRGFYSVSQRNFMAERGDFASPDGETTIIADNPEGILGENPNFRTSVNGQDIYNPFLYGDFRRYEEDGEITDATNLVGKFDMTRSFTIGKAKLLLKFGGKYRTQDNSKTRDNVIFVINDPNNAYDEENSFLRSLEGVEPTNYLYSDYRFGPLIGQDAFRSEISNARRFLNSDFQDWNSRQISLNDTYDAKEDIYAAYFMGKLNIDKWMILAGLRMEYNQVAYDAFDVFRFGNNIEASPISGGNEYQFWLPNFHVKYNLTDYTSFRFSTVMNYARPNFVDVVPFVDLDQDAFRLRLGNEDLRPAEAVNVDLMFEHYFKDVGVVSLGAFYKRIDGFQFTRFSPSLTSDFPGYPNTTGFQFSQEQNGDIAEVAGMEFNFFRSLGFLPGFFKNFNVEGNYTYAFSEASTQDRSGVSLPGQAEHTFNAALAFDYKDFTARISANYNGSFLNSLADDIDSSNDEIQEERLQIDANASLKLGKNFRIYIEGINLFNEPTIRYQGNRDQISRVAYFGWILRTGISYSL